MDKHLSPYKALTDRLHEGMPFVDHAGIAAYDNEKEDKAFLNNAIDALSKIAGGAFGEALVEYLIQSDQTVTITESKDKNNFNADESIRWNPNNYDGGISNDPILGYSTYRSPEIGLSHELGHAADYVYGTINPHKWNELKSNSVAYSERTAVLIENFVRKERRHAPRFYYQGYRGLPIVESHINNMPEQNLTIIQILYNRSMIKQAPSVRNLIDSAIRTILK